MSYADAVNEKTKDIKPVTREEMFLQKIADNVSGGGGAGGGGNIPLYDLVPTGEIINNKDYGDKTVVEKKCVIKTIDTGEIFDIFSLEVNTAINLRFDMSSNVGNQNGSVFVNIPCFIYPNEAYEKNMRGVYIASNDEYINVDLYPGKDIIIKHTFVQYERLVKNILDTSINEFVAPFQVIEAENTLLYVDGDEEYLPFDMAKFNEVGNNIQIASMTHNAVLNINSITLDPVSFTCTSPTGENLVFNIPTE